MQWAIYYKWQTYGKRLHTFQFLLFCVAFIALISAQMIYLYKLPNPIGFWLCNVIAFMISITMIIVYSGQFFLLGWNSKHLYRKSVLNLTFGLRHYFSIFTYLCMLITSILLSFCRICILHAVVYTFTSIMAGISNLLMAFMALYFLRAYSWSGHFIRMLLKMPIDLSPFIVIQLITLVGFSSAFMVVVGPGSTFTGMNAPLALVSMFFGDADLEDMEASDENKSKTRFAKLFFLLFVLFFPIVLMNLLIAILGDSYDSVRANQKLYGLVEKANAIFDIDILFHKMFSEEQKNELFPKYFHVLDKAKAKKEDEEIEDFGKWDGQLRSIYRYTLKQNEKLKSFFTQLILSKEAEKRLTIEHLAKLLKMHQERADHIDTSVEEIRGMMQDFINRHDQVNQTLDNVGKDLTHIKLILEQDTDTMNKMKADNLLLPRVNIKLHDAER